MSLSDISPGTGDPSLSSNAFPPLQTTSATSSAHNQEFTPLVSVVDFHHVRGPEVEFWFGAPENSDPAIENDWPLLPFMALSDGAHASTQEFSYFTLLRKANPTQTVTSLFGIACSRQIDASMLINRPHDVTRSTVQKAVVVIADSPQSFGMLRERLSVVTTAWFTQRDFKDTEILKRFQESLKEEKERTGSEAEREREAYPGLSLRELVRQFRWQTLVLFKCCLLQPKMLFFGSKCEKLCMTQFSLISLIPGLIRNLQACADPELDSYERNMAKPTSLKTSDRNSLLAYMGMPLHIFGKIKGSLFGPYTPLQQLDILADFGTKSYIVGSTNSLLLQQKDRYSDILINLDEDSINISSSSLRSALTLSLADRRWIDLITQSVNDTWDESNPSRPKNMGFIGSDEFIRLQFEEYLISLLSSVKYYKYTLEHENNPGAIIVEVEGDPSYDFGKDWMEAWTRSENHRIWDSQTDSQLFDIVEPKHPCAGGLTIEDVKARMMEQVKEFHLDERFAVGKEILGRNLLAGKEKANTLLSKLYSDMEALRDSQKRKVEDAKDKVQENDRATPIEVDTNVARFTAQSVGSKAGAYIGSWGVWMEEKRKTGWGSTPFQRRSEGLPEKEKITAKEPEENSTHHKKSFAEPFFDADHPLSPEDLHSATTLTRSDTTVYPSDVSGKENSKKDDKDKAPVTIEIKNLQQMDLKKQTSEGNSA
ncbi:transport protein Avl9 [Blumeria hordei DH14]|uniref:Transport protein Avl9 n=1 Tax=Blumeria graminis f. sp. hordei (strain DH14) TaxID=546991 RepID=N1J506_BLUG1|nr:transport protein Avl9 [Blumeria hordei DH14]